MLRWIKGMCYMVRLCPKQTNKETKSSWSITRPLMSADLPLTSQSGVTHSDFRLPGGRPGSPVSLSFVRGVESPGAAGRSTGQDSCFHGSHQQAVFPYHRSPGWAGPMLPCSLATGKGVRRNAQSKVERRRSHKGKNRGAGEGQTG